MTISDAKAMLQSDAQDTQRADQLYNRSRQAAQDLSGSILRAAQLEIEQAREARAAAVFEDQQAVVALKGARAKAAALDKAKASEEEKRLAQRELDLAQQRVADNEAADARLAQSEADLRTQVAKAEKAGAKAAAGGTDAIVANILRGVSDASLQAQGVTGREISSESEGGATGSLSFRKATPLDEAKASLGDFRLPDVNVELLPGTGTFDPNQVQTLPLRRGEEAQAKNMPLEFDREQTIIFPAMGEDSPVAPFGLGTGKVDSRNRDVRRAPGSVTSRNEDVRLALPGMMNLGLDMSTVTGAAADAAASDSDYGPPPGLSKYPGPPKGYEDEVAQAELQTIDTVIETSLSGIEKPDIPDIDYEMSKARGLDDSLRLKQLAAAKAMSEPVKNLQAETLAIMKADPKTAKRVEKLGDLHIMGRIAEYEKDLDGAKLARDQANYNAAAGLRAGNRADREYELSILRAGLNAQMSVAGMEMNWANLMSAEERAQWQMHHSEAMAVEATSRAVTVANINAKRRGSGLGNKQARKDFRKSYERAAREIAKFRQEWHMRKAELGMLNKDQKEITNASHLALLAEEKKGLQALQNTPEGRLFMAAERAGVSIAAVENMFDGFDKQGMTPQQAHNAVLDSLLKKKPGAKSVYDAPVPREQAAKIEQAKEMAEATVSAGGGPDAFLQRYTAAMQNDPGMHKDFMGALNSVKQAMGLADVTDGKSLTPEQREELNRRLAVTLGANQALQEAQ